MQLADRAREGQRVRGHLHEEGVVVRAHPRPGVAAAAVEADPHPGAGAEDLDAPGVGLEALLRVLGGDAALHRDAARGDRALRQAEDVEGRAARDEDLRLHEIDAGDLLGHRVLDLDARVGLDEVVAALAIDEELDRARVPVADRLRELHRVAAEPLAERLVEVLGGRHLDHLLVAALHAAVALEEVDHVARRVGEDLHLDVPRVLDEALDEDGAVAERRGGLGPSPRERRLELARVSDDAHPAPSAAHRGLDDERVAGLAREGLRLLEGRHGPVGAGDGGDAGLVGEGARGGLVAERAQHVGRRTDERDAGVGARLAEARVLGEEAVAGVDRVDAGVLGDADDLVDREVGADRAEVLADEVALVRLVAVQVHSVFVAVDRHRTEPELRGGPKHADRDLPAVRAHELLQRAGHASALPHGPTSAGPSSAQRASKASRSRT